MQNFVYEWVDFSNFPQNRGKIGSSLRKFWKIEWFCQKFVPKLSRLVWMGHFSWKFVFVWVYFQIPRWHIPSKTKLECPWIWLTTRKVWEVVKVEALWFGWYGVIIWCLSGKNGRELFLLFSLSVIFCVIRVRNFQCAFLRKFIITSLRSYALG